MELEPTLSGTPSHVEQPSAGQPKTVSSPQGGVASKGKSLDTKEIIKNLNTANIDELTYALKDSKDSLNKLKLHVWQFHQEHRKTWQVDEGLQARLKELEQQINKIQDTIVKLQKSK